LGDDSLAKAYFGMTSLELCEKLASYENLRILISFESSDPEVQQKKVGPGVQEYAGKRNKAIENLVKTGFNADPKNQKMAMICAPVLENNADEALEIFKWGTKRNIPVIIAPTMLSGAGNTAPEIKDRKFKEETLVNLYGEIYSWLIQEKILTLDQVKAEGVSPYAGYACNQFISGMFIRQDGVVRACPGNDSDAFKYQKDVRGKDLKEIWINSLGYKIRDGLIKNGELKVTTPCYAKTEGGLEYEAGGPLVPEGSIPKDFYKMVLDKIKG